MSLPNLFHKHIAEAVIVILLICILLTIFIPKFMDAQVSTKITQAKLDLQRIIHTVDLLEQQFPDDVIYSVHLYSKALGQSAKVFHVRSTKLDTAFPFPNPNRDLKDPFIQLMGTMPVQQLPLPLEVNQSTRKRSPFDDVININELNQNRAFNYQGPKTIVQTDGIKLKYLRDLNSLKSGKWDVEGIAYSPGPVLKPDILQSIVYDVSNGLLSHGYLVQLRTAGKE